jgi:amino acid transporter
MPEGPTQPQRHTRLSWKEGLFLVGPDPLTSPYYSSGALILAGVGYATPGFQIGLYGVLFLLAPLYIEAVLLTLSNGGTYVMTRYALSHLGKLATITAAVVGVVISFSYVATAIVSLLSYSDYVGSLVSGLDSGRTVAAIGLSAIPSLGFGVWVMPQRWRQTTLVVLGVSLLAIALSPIIPSGVVVMLAPVMLLFMLNNEGLRESVQVSKTIFLTNLVVMGVTILFGLIWLLLNDFGHYEFFLEGHEFRRAIEAGAGPAPAHPLAEGDEQIRNLPGIATLGAALIPAALGSSILGASGVESVMNIPEELESPRTDIRRIYMWMLTILLVIGGSLALLVFLVLPPKDLVGAAGYLLAVLGRTTVTDVTGSELLGDFWNIVIVANAALMLLGATNTGFAGARGLWVTMARDNLLPRMVLDTNDRGAFSRIHLLMLIAIFALCWEADADSEVLERWYGATFGLVMFSGVVAFVLLRKFKARDRRLYTAPFNISLGGLRVPIAALVGTAFLSFALLGLYDRYAEQINDLRALIVTMAMLVGAVLLGYNHRPLIRIVYAYFRRTVETVEGDAIETGERTIVVAVADVRMTRLIDQAIALARVQSRVTGIPYTQIVVFHMTSSINREHVYRVERNSMRPASVEGNVIRIHTELTERAPEDMRLFLAIVPKRHREMDNLEAAMEELADFHERHGFRGHIVMIGDVGVTEAVSSKLQERLGGSTLVTVPVS